jgi:hypothetical protein
MKKLILPVVSGLAASTTSAFAAQVNPIPTVPDQSNTLVLLAVACACLLFVAYHLRRKASA